MIIRPVVLVGAIHLPLRLGVHGRDDHDAPVVRDPTVVIMQILTTGERQLVVHEAFEMTTWSLLNS